MRAIILEKFGSIDNLQYKETTVPEPRPGELLVKVKYVAINQYDYKVIADGVGEKAGVQLPLIPGAELSGTVEKTGTGTTGFQPGDAVFGALSVYGGCYATFAIAKETDVIKKPTGIPFDSAAAIAIGALTSWKALFDAADLQARQKILILGASGSVGSIALQLAKIKGAYTIALASGESETLIKSLHADEFIDYTQRDFTTLVKDVDVVLDFVGGSTQERSFAVLKEGGILVSLVQPPSQELAEKHKVKAQVIFNAPTPNAKRLNEISQLVENGELKIFIDRIFPLADAKNALGFLRTGHKQGKVLLEAE